MNYEIKYYPELQYVEVVSIGKFGFTDYAQQIDEAASFGIKNNTFLFLVNNIQLTNMASISDIYKLPGLYRKIIPEKDLKIAALFSEESKNKEAISFYENICVNQGLNVKTFFNREEAFKWLLSA